MKSNQYKPRIIDEQVETYLSTFGAVCIEGPKWCGKTWTSKHHSQSAIYISDPEGNFANRRLAEMSPALVLQGMPPRLIDEWQEVPSLWDAVRHEVDRRGEKGQFILTGSATPNRKGVLHSGAGRIALLRLSPMTLFEAGRSSGLVSLKELCEGQITPALTGEVKLQDIVDFIVRGGWPGSQDLPLKDAALIPKEYIDVILKNDIQILDDVKRDDEKMRLLMRSLARNESTTASVSTIIKDVMANDKGSINRETVGVYLNILQRLFLIENQQPFGEKLRSSVKIKQAEKRHLADPSLAVALLDASSDTLLRDLETLGFLFEALCERDLRVYATSFGAKLYHYQDYANREVDAVIALQDGTWCAFEIKLGANQVDEAAFKLTKLSADLEQEGGTPPAVLCVISGLSQAAYRRNDGVFVVPITALRH